MIFIIFLWFFFFNLENICETYVLFGLRLLLNPH